ncbi:hypothetical protein L1987_74396 [Smallanthus sonchifolius]|uniref:Uncharacterized protein n=1 Tax=Smallanthus sonchifolius TaxID=185202 RepID=A0ACB9A2H9_9ASTR|nr:hypothetical protein L1987_74396 [Smallanthus sonchifolius]
MSSQSKSVSVSAPSSTSGLVNHIPPLPSFQKKNDSQPRKTVSTGFSGSGIFTSPPVLLSNDELLKVFSKVKQQMEQQKKTNQTIFRELERIKDSKKPVEMTTPLQPRALNFDYPGSSGVHQGDFLPMRTGVTTLGPTPATRVTATQDLGFIPGSSLRDTGMGSALKRILNVPSYSITSFAYLINLFNSQFSCSRTFERLTSHPYRVIQNPWESLRDYVNKFAKESLDIPNLDVATAVQAFKMGLRKDSQFYEDFVMNPCRNLDEFKNRALRFIRLEDDKKIQQRMDAPTSYSQPNRKTETAPFKPYISKPYSKPDNHRINVVEDDEVEEEYPKFSEYYFSLDTTGLLYAMQDLGDKARWPRKFEKTIGGKDKSKWCAFHEDFGHNTEDCIALRKEINYLLSKGYLKEFLGKGKKQVRDQDKIPQRAKSPPPDAKVICFIYGGSYICGTSYSAAKRNAKEAKTEKGDRSLRTSILIEEKIISFNEDDRDNVQDPHHDDLVITLYVVNHFIRRILIDGGSSVNIIQHDVLKRMGIPDSEFISKSAVVVGFSRVKNTVGEIKIPKQARDVLEAKEQDVKELPLKPEDPDVKLKKAEDHPSDLEEALDILDHYNMKLNPSKCHFGVGAVKFLGYMVTKRGIEASPKQINAIINLKSPANTKDVQRLSGRAATLNKFISRSLERLSGHCVSVVLVKDHEGQQHPVYYVCKSLLLAETMYSHLEKLILALIMASTKLRHYFETHAIHVKTNYPIKCVLRKPEMSGRMAKWSVKFSAYDLIYEPRTKIKSQALAYFVADFSNDIHQKADLEVQQLEESKDTWILFTDGASNIRGTCLIIILK